MEDVIGFVLALGRTSGFVLLNPILGRKGMPGMARAGMCILLAATVYGAAWDNIPPVRGWLELIIMLFLEFAVGWTAGFIVTLFSSAILFGGELVDYQVGLSMSKVFDPQSNLSLSVNSSMYNIMFLLLFFAGGGHLNLILVLRLSAEIVPPGMAALGDDLVSYIIQLFSQSLILGVKLAMPVIAVEFLLEIAVGVLMKAIPQINVFVINIQAKVLLGLAVIAAFFVPTANFIEKMISTMFGAIENVYHLIK